MYLEVCVCCVYRFICMWGTEFCIFKSVYVCVRCLSVRAWVCTHMRICMSAYLFMCTVLERERE